MSQSFEMYPQDPGESFIALPGVNLNPKKVVARKRELVVPKSKEILQPQMAPTGGGASVNTIRNRSFFHDYLPSGLHNVEHWRQGRLFNVYEMPNGITVEGKNHVLDVAFRAQTESPLWYLGAIDLLNYTALTENDTYDNIDQAGNGWDEFKGYSFAAVATDRVTWVPAAASGKSITNSATPGIFDITATGTVKGIFLAGQPTGAGALPGTQGDHAPGGILWSTALFTTGDVAVVNGDQLKVTYTISS